MPTSESAASTASRNATELTAGVRARRSHSVSVFVERIDVTVYAHVATPPDVPAVSSADVDEMLSNGFLEQHHRRHSSMPALGSPSVEASARAAAKQSFDPFGGVPVLMHASVRALTFRRQTVAVDHHHKQRRWFLGVHAAALSSMSATGAVVPVFVDGSDVNDAAATEHAVRAQQATSLFGSGATLYVDGDDLPLPAADATHLGVDGIRAVDAFADCAVSSSACALLSLAWQSGGAAPAQLDGSLGSADRGVLLRVSSDVREQCWINCVLNVVQLYTAAKRDDPPQPPRERQFGTRVHANLRCGPLAVQVISQSLDSVVSVAQLSIGSLSVSSTTVAADAPPSAPLLTRLRIDALQLATVSNGALQPILTRTDEQMLSLSAELRQTDNESSLVFDDTGAGLLLRLTPQHCESVLHAIGVWIPEAREAILRSPDLPPAALRLDVRQWSVQCRADSVWKLARWMQTEVRFAQLLLAFEDAHEPLVQIDGVECASRADATRLAVSRLSTRADLPRLAAWIVVGAQVARSTRSAGASVRGPRRRFSVDVASAKGSVSVGTDVRVNFASSGLKLSTTGAEVQTARVFVGDNAPTNLLELDRFAATLGADTTAVVVVSVRSSVSDADVTPLVAVGRELVQLAAAVGAGGGSALQPTARALSVDVNAAEFHLSPRADAALPSRYSCRVTALTARLAAASSLELGALEVECDAAEHAQLVRWPASGDMRAITVHVDDSGAADLATAPLNATVCAAHMLHCAPMLGALRSIVPARQSSSSSSSSAVVRRRFALQSAEIGAIDVALHVGSVGASAFRAVVAGARLESSRALRVDGAALLSSVANQAPVVAPFNVLGTVGDGGTLEIAPSVSVNVTLETLERLLQFEKMVRRARKVVRPSDVATPSDKRADALFAFRVHCGEARATLHDDVNGAARIVVVARTAVIDSALGAPIRVRIGTVNATALTESANAPLLTAATPTVGAASQLTMVYSPAHDDITIDVDSGVSPCVHVGPLLLNVVARIIQQRAETVVESRRVVHDVRGLIERLFVQRVDVNEVLGSGGGVRVRLIGAALVVELSDKRNVVRLETAQWFALRASHDPRPSRDDDIAVQCNFVSVRAHWLDGGTATPLASRFDTSVALAYGARGPRVDASVGALSVRLDCEHALRVVTSAIAFVDTLIDAFAKTPAPGPRAPPLPSEVVDESLAAFRWPSAAERAEFSTLVDADDAAGAVGAHLSDIDVDSRASFERQRALRSTHEAKCRRTKPARNTVLVDISGSGESEARVWCSFRFADTRVLHQVSLATSQSASPCRGDEHVGCEHVRFGLVRVERWDCLQRHFVPVDSTRVERSALRITGVNGARVASSSFRVLCDVTSLAGYVTVDSAAVRCALASALRVRSEKHVALVNIARVSIAGSSLTVTLDDERARTRLLKAAGGGSSATPPVPAPQFGADDSTLASAVFVEPTLRVRLKRVLPLDTRAGVAVSCGRGRLDVHMQRRARALAMFERVGVALMSSAVSSSDEPSVAVWRALVRCGALALTVDPQSVARIADAAALAMRPVNAPLSLALARRAALALLPHSVFVVNVTNVAFELRVGINVIDVEPHAFVPHSCCWRGGVSPRVDLRARVSLAGTDAASVVCSIDVGSDGFRCASFPFGPVWVHVARSARAASRAWPLVLTVLGSHVLVNESGVALDFALQSSSAFAGLVSNVRALAPTAQRVASVDDLRSAAIDASARGVCSSNDSTNVLLRATGAWDWSVAVPLRDGDAAVEVDCDVRLSTAVGAATRPMASSSTATRLLVHVHTERPVLAGPALVRLSTSLLALNRTPWWLVCRFRLSSGESVVASLAPGVRTPVPCGDVHGVVHMTAWIDGCAAVESAVSALPAEDGAWTLLAVAGETTTHTARAHLARSGATTWQCVVAVPTLVCNHTALKLHVREAGATADDAAIAVLPIERDGVGAPFGGTADEPALLCIGQVDDRTGSLSWSQGAAVLASGRSGALAPLGPGGGVVVATCRAGAEAGDVVVDLDGWLVVTNDTDAAVLVRVGASQRLHIGAHSSMHCTAGELTTVISLALAARANDDDDDDDEKIDADAVRVQLVASDEPQRVIVGARAFAVSVSSREPALSYCVRVCVDAHPPCSVQNSLDRDVWFRVSDADGVVCVPARATRAVSVPSSVRESAVRLLHDASVLDGESDRDDSSGGTDVRVSRVRNAVAVASSASSVQPMLAQLGTRNVAGELEWSVPFAAGVPGSWTLMAGGDSSDPLRLRVLFDGASRIIVVERSDIAAPAPTRARQFVVSAQCDLMTAAVMDDGDGELLVATMDDIDATFGKLSPSISVPIALGAAEHTAQHDTRFAAVPHLYHISLIASAIDVGVHDDRVDHGVVLRAPRSEPATRGQRPLLLAATLSDLGAAPTIVSCRVDLQPMTVALEDTVWELHLQPLQRQFAAALRLGERRAAAAVDLAAAPPLIYVHHASISALDTDVSARAREPVAVGFHRFPLTLAPVQLHAVRVRLAPLLRAALLHYAQDVLQRAPAVLGSLDLLGNPTGMLRELSAGVRDAVLLPLEGVRRLSPSGFAVGFARGLGSLVQHVAIGSFASINALSLGVARNLDPAPDGRQTHTSGGPLFGFVRGMAGLVTEPVRGARTGGVSGAAAGMARGIIGMAARPVGGIFEWVGAVTGDALWSVGGARTQRPRRVPIAPWRQNAAHFRALLAQSDAQLSADEHLLLVTRARLVSTSAHSEVACTLLASARRLFVVQHSDAAADNGGGDERLLRAIELSRVEVPHFAPAGALVVISVTGERDPIELRANATSAAVAQHASDLDLDEFVRDLGALKRQFHNDVSATAAASSPTTASVS
jgi:hypothetical protein